MSSRWKTKCSLPRILIAKPPDRIEIEATEFHLERRESYYLVRFIDLEGRLQRIRIGRELFVSSEKVVEQLLKANGDLPDNPKAAERLVRHALANRSKKTLRITLRTGWHGTSFVYPGETFGPLAGKLEHEGASEIDPALGLRAGTPEAWWKGLRRALDASDYLTFAVSVGLSGPLFDVAGGQEGMVFHFQPQDSTPAKQQVRTQSSSGKSLAARAAISTVGRAKKTDLISYAVTLRAAEDYCYSHSNLVAALDEEGRALLGTGRHIKPSQLPYLVASGRGTLYSKKAVRDQDLRNLTWLLPVISTGEKPLDDPKNQRVRTEGAQVRMAPIPVPSSGSKGGIINRLNGSPAEIVKEAHLLALEVEKTLDQNYGVVMPAFLRRLVLERAFLERRVRRIIDKFVDWVGAGSDPWERRFAEKFGIVLAAAIFASNFGMAPWTEKRAADAIRTIYRRSRAALASVNEATDVLIVTLRQALAAGRFPHLNKGQTLQPEAAGRAWGVAMKSAQGGVVVIRLRRLQGLVRPCQLIGAMIAEMAARKLLIKAPDGKNTRELMIRGLHGSKRRRYVVLSLSGLTI